MARVLWPLSSERRRASGARVMRFRRIARLTRIMIEGSPSTMPRMSAIASHMEGEATSLSGRGKPSVAVVRLRWSFSASAVDFRIVGSEECSAISRGNRVLGYAGSDEPHRPGSRR